MQPMPSMGKNTSFGKVITRLEDSHSLCSSLRSLFNFFFEQSCVVLLDSSRCRFIISNFYNSYLNKINDIKG